MLTPEYPVYDSYRDSGEGWLAEVPSHWETRKLKQLFREKKHRRNIALNCGAISFGEVVEKDDDRIPIATKASYQEVCTGEFLVNPLNLNYDLKSLRIALSQIDVVVSAGYIVLLGQNEMEKGYYKYLLHRYDVANMKLLGSGVRQTISFNHIANSILLTPPLNEQGAITKFLDERCSKIDQAISIKEQQIALLKERKQIIVQEAVTKGLNPNAPMKDSGIDWIGNIPVHWEIWKVAHAFRDIGSGTTPETSTSAYYEGDTPWLQTGDLTDGAIYTTNKTLSNIALCEHSTLKVYEPGSLVIAMYGATIGKLGLLKIASTTNQACCVLGASKLLKPDFSFFFFLAARANLISESYGGGQPNISQQTIRAYRIAVPPISEQNIIISYVSEGCRKIDEGVAIKKKQITALKEYKTSLINAAVTGKIKVV